MTTPAFVLVKGIPMLWSHKPNPARVEVDPLMLSILETGEDNMFSLYGKQEGVTEIKVWPAGRDFPTTLTVQIEADRTSEFIVRPEVRIKGPKTLRQGDTAKYRAVLSGGKYDKVLDYTWSCGAKGNKAKAIVDATGRPEGLIQVCCTVRIEAAAGNNRVVRSAAGSVQVMIEEPD